MYKSKFQVWLEQVVENAQVQLTWDDFLGRLREVGRLAIPARSTSYEGDVQGQDVVWAKEASEDSFDSQTIFYLRTVPEEAKVWLVPHNNPEEGYVVVGPSNRPAFVKYELSYLKEDRVLVWGKAEGFLREPFLAYGKGDFLGLGLEAKEILYPEPVVSVPAHLAGGAQIIEGDYGEVNLLGAYLFRSEVAEFVRARTEELRKEISDLAAWAAGL